MGFQGSKFEPGNVPESGSIAGAGSYVGLNSDDEFILTTIVSTGDAGTPGGSNTQVQFNDGGTLAGDSGLIFAKSANQLSVLGPISGAAEGLFAANLRTSGQLEVSGAAWVEGQLNVTGAAVVTGTLSGTTAILANDAWIAGEVRTSGSTRFGSVDAGNSDQSFTHRFTGSLHVTSSTLNPSIISGSLTIQGTTPNLTLNSATSKVNYIYFKQGGALKHAINTGEGGALNYYVNTNDLDQVWKGKTGGTGREYLRVDSSAQQLVVNDADDSIDLRVEGDNDTHLLFVDASGDAVGIGVSTAAPDAVLDLEGDSAQAKPTLIVTHAEDTNNAINIVADSLTTANVLDVTADALTTGKILNLVSDIGLFNYWNKNVGACA